MRFLLLVVVCSLVAGCATPGLPGSADMSPAKAAAPELVSIDVRRTSMFGGPEQDVKKMAADFFSIPELAFSAPELAHRNMNIRSVLQKRFPRGMKRNELLLLLRKVRVQHLCETDMRDMPEFTVNGVLQSSRIEFDVKTYTLIQASTAGAQVEEEVREYIFTFMFEFSNNGELTDVSAGGIASIPL